MKNIKLILTLAAVAATMALGGCGGPGFVGVKVQQKYKTTIGYSYVPRTLMVIGHGFYDCNAVEPKSICNHRDNYRWVFSMVQDHFSGPNMFVSMLVPKTVKIHSHDIVRFKNARVTGGAIGPGNHSVNMSAQFDGIARKYNQQDKSCHIASEWCANCGVVRCNGWDGARFYKTGDGYAN